MELDYNMPIIKSAVKRVKQADKHRERNIQFKRTLKNNTRALDAAIDSNDSKKAKELLGKVYGSYDAAVKKNLLHKNKAARKKAFYAARVKSIASPKSKKITPKKSSPPAAKK